MKKITIVVDAGGMIDKVFVPSEIADDVYVEIIDFCTNDPDEIDEATADYNKIVNNIKYDSVY